MVNKQRLMKIAALFAVGVIVYALRPMPEYALHARTAAGMYELTNVNDQQTLDVLGRLATCVEAELISAQAMLDMPSVPQEALPELAHHLNEMASLSKDMNQQLNTRFGKERVEDMINLPTWATETLAMSQVISQNNKPLEKLGLSRVKHRQLQGDLQWIERTLTDLQELIRRALPIPDGQNAVAAPTKASLN